MRKLIAWFGVATLCVLTSHASAANDVLKPYVVLILDTSGSMLDTTGSGPTSCGKIDNRINHAVCAINNIVNSYGDMVFSLARFREATNGTYSTSCDANGDQLGNHNLDTPTVPINLFPNGGDQCSTQGPFCGDCSAAAGLGRSCTNNNECWSNSCVGNRCANPAGANTVLTTTACTVADDAIEILTPLVDGNNVSASRVTNGTCATCAINGTTDPEIWGVSANTFTPLAAVLNGVRRYWQGQQATNSTTLWSSTLAGFDPINRDPQNAVFLPKTGQTQCQADDTICDHAVACTGANCCCATQCRPYVTILLTDGDETCANFSTSTLGAADSLLLTQPRQDNAPVNTFQRTGNFTTVVTTGAHPFAVGNKIIVSGFGDATFNGTFTVTAVTNSTTFTFANSGTNTPGAISGTPAQVRHAASNSKFRIDMKPIGFGKAPGDPQIEDLAHHGGAADMPGVNEGYYAASEQDLELAISQILADSVRSESCNLRDDDCDTRVDEDFPNKDQACQATWPAGDPLAGSVAVGTCANTGVFECKGDGTGTQCDDPNTHQPLVPHPRGTEVCNQTDDDCDGRVDEGLACQCVETAEICDNKDNDCDTVPDQKCRCSNNNTVKCDGTNNGANGTNPQCTAGTSTGSCGCTPLADQACSITNSFGVCPGTSACTNGTPGACSGTPAAAEICDGKDNDCNGVCDGISFACSEVSSNCVGTVVTSCPPNDNPGEVGHGPILHSEKTWACENAVDDDGDNKINDGCPIWPTAGGVAETACDDAVDDDNDGHVNDGCPAVATAHIPENICHAGQKTCAVPLLCPNAGGNAFGICSGEQKPQGSDPCNAQDDDCDNAIDEDFVPADCSTNCGIGTTKCENGQIKCNRVPTGTDTTCNNIDDDCNGIVDDGWMCNPAANCTGPDCCSCGSGTTCETRKCINGVRTCVTDPPILTEVCDCNDNNCNGFVDEGTLCPTGATCTSCQCAFPCDPLSEFPCPAGKLCEPALTTMACAIDGDCPTGQTCNQTKHKCSQGNFCVNDPCFGISCPPVSGHLQVCQRNPDPAHANEPQCVDACSLQSCSVGFVCLDSDGQCHPNDCTTFPDMCTTMQSCVVRDGLGTCVTNPCQGVTCDSGKYCLGGTCVGSCADIDCASGQRCRQGMCETDPCGHPCPFGQACNDNTGKCIADPCTVKDCGTGTGQWCNPNSGQCEDDPCVINAITCPNAGEICRGGTCLDPDTLRPDAAGESHVTVGGGGGCSTTGNGSTGVLLALALLVIRRRRARASSVVRGDGGAL